MDAGWWSPSPSASPPPPPRAPPRCRCRPLSNSYNCLPHYDGWPDVEDESTGGALRERELRSLHRTVPALRRRELDTRAIKHHFYPEGGWGIQCTIDLYNELLHNGKVLSKTSLLFKYFNPSFTCSSIITTLLHDNVIISIQDTILDLSCSNFHICEKEEMLETRKCVGK